MHNNNNNNLLLIERYLQTQINSALQSNILITTLILITDIKMSTKRNTNIMIYNTILVGYIKLNHYRNDFLKRKVLIEFLKVSHMKIQL